MRALASCESPEDHNAVFGPDFSLLRNNNKGLGCELWKHAEEYSKQWLEDYKRDIEFAHTYGNAVAKAFREAKPFKDNKVLESFEDALGKKFAKNKADNGFEVKSMNHLIFQLSAVGLCHAQTIVFTKLFFGPTGMSYNNMGVPDSESRCLPIKRENDSFTELDFEIVAVAFATITGQIDERRVFIDPSHLMSSFTQEERANVTASIGDKVILDEKGPIWKQLKQFANANRRRQISNLKNMRELLGDKEFCRVGWIYASAFPEGFSDFVKTLLTYI